MRYIIILLTLLFSGCTLVYSEYHREVFTDTRWQSDDGTIIELHADDTFTATNVDWKRMEECDSDSLPKDISGVWEIIRSNYEYEIDECTSFVIHSNYIKIEGNTPLEDRKVYLDLHFNHKYIPTFFGDELELWYFIGDPDEANIIRFKQVK